MKRKLLVLLLFVFSIGISYAQREIRGKVTSSEDGSTLPGVNVIIVGTQQGSVTDVDGNYTITVQEGASLQFSYIGYADEIFLVGNQSIINVSLVPDLTQLQEIVVTALGIEKEKKSIGYAVSEIKGKEITQAGAPTIGNALYGKAAGVQITNNSGGPTAGTNIVIRGNNSLMYSNRPLIVVDGIPIEDSDSQYGRWGGSDPGTGINDINPEDIQSMDILKGANAAALYGSKAANGVVIITTKKGADSKGLGIDFSTTNTIDKIAFTPNFQNEFGAGYGRVYGLGSNNDGEWNLNDDGVRLYPGSWASFGPKMEGQSVLWWDGEMRDYTPQPNNYEDLFVEGHTSTSSLAFSNSGDRGSFRFAYTNYDYAGTWHGVKQKKNTIALNSSLKISNKVTADVSFNYMNINTKNRPPRLSGLVGYEYPRSTKSDLIFQYYKDDLGYRATSDDVPYSAQRNIMNTLWDSKENQQNEFKDRILGNVTLRYNITDFLRFRIKAGSDFSTLAKENKSRNTQPAELGPTGAYSTEKIQLKNNYADAILTYADDFGDDWSLELNAGARTIYEANSNVYSGTNGGLVVEDWFSLNNSANTLNSNGSRGDNRTDAFMGFGQLGYKDMLFLNFTATNEWTSTLPADNNSYFYPSVSLGWVFSESLTMPSWLSYGKVRGSWAEVGNGAPRYLANNTYSYSNYNGITTNSFSSSVPPPSLKPERQKSIEFGTELSLFSDRIGLDVTYYKNNNYDQIMPLSVATSSGASSVVVNAGELQNQGIEVQLNAAILKQGDFNWNVTLNWAKNSNKVVELAKGIESLVTSDFNYPMYQEARIGQPSGSFVTYAYLRDDDGNKIIDGSGFPIRDTELSIVGNSTPDWIGGIVNNFSWKGLYVNFLIDMKMGGDMFSFTNFYGVGSGKMEESLPYRNEEHGGLAYYTDDNGVYQVLPDHNSTAPNGNPVYHDGIIIEGVTESGEENTQVMSSEVYYIDAYYWNYGFHEEGLFDNSYVKFREATIGYTFPSSLIGNKVFQNLTVSFIGRNLFYLYKSIPNIDPESSIGTDRQTAAQEYGAYPSTRSYGFSIRASF